MPITTRISKPQVIKSMNGFFIGTIRWSYNVTGFITHSRESEYFSTYQAAALYQAATPK